MFTLTSQDQHGVMIEEKKIKKISNAYNQEGSRWGVYDTDGISPTMTKAMGDGGGHVPMIKSIQPNKGGRGSGKFSIKNEESHCIPANPMSDNKPTIISEPKIYDAYNNRMREDGNCGTLTRESGRGDGGAGMNVVANSFIRRLTPIECERLQGFPDGWTEGQSDTQRYKQLGNAVSVPVVKAVGERLIKNIP